MRGHVAGVDRQGRGEALGHALELAELPQREPERRVRLEVPRRALHGAGVVPGRFAPAPDVLEHDAEVEAGGGEIGRVANGALEGLERVARAAELHISDAEPVARLREIGRERQRAPIAVDGAFVVLELEACGAQQAVQHERVRVLGEQRAHALGKRREIPLPVQGEQRIQRFAVEGHGRRAPTDGRQPPPRPRRASRSAPSAVSSGSRWCSKRRHCSAPAR